jgi:uncharacterized coiled-coil DUF342 family protein
MPSDSGLIVSIAISTCSLIGALVAIIFTGIRSRVEKVENKGENHETRITKLETAKEHEITELRKEISELKKDFSDLKQYVHEYIHTERNNSQKMTETLERISEALANGIVR